MPFDHLLKYIAKIVCQASLPSFLTQTRRNRGNWGAEAPQILVKVDLVPIDNNSKKIKGAKKYKPYKIPRKLLVTLLLFT